MLHNSSSKCSIVICFPTGKLIASGLQEVLFQRLAHAPEATLMQHVREREFPDRRLRKKTLEGAFQANVMNCGSMSQSRKCKILSPLQLGTAGLTLQADKQHYLEYTTRGRTRTPLLFVFSPSWTLRVRFTPV